MSIQFFKRDDGSSLATVGSNIIRLITTLRAHDVNIWDIGHADDNGQTIKKSTLGMAYGLVPDMIYLNMFRRKVAGLVCETDLTKYETMRIKEIDPTEIWVPSEFCLQKFMDAGFKFQTVVVPHGVDALPIIKNKEKKNKVLMLFNSYKRPNAHVKRKGIFEVLEAFKELKDTRLILRTKHQAYYDKYDLSNVEFIENRIEDLSSLYEEVDAVLCPSHAEGYGLVGLEAMARGIPVISTKTGNDYLTKEWVYGHIDLPVTKEKIVHALTEFYSQFGFYRGYALEQAPRIQEKHSWWRLVDQLRKRLQILTKR